jgi:LPS sulfotransferase NodH
MRLIVGTERTGSSLVYTTLSETGIAHPLYEPFNSVDFRPCFREIKEDRFCQDRFSNPMAYLRWLVGKNGDRIPKLLLEHTTLGVIEQLVQEPIKVVFVFRLNLTEQYVSLKRAEATKLWALHLGEARCDAPVRINTAEAIKQMNRWFELETGCHRVLSAHTVRVLPIEYRRIAEKLDVARQFFNVSYRVSPLQKQALGYGTVQNFDEVQSVLGDRYGFLGGDAVPGIWNSTPWAMEA